MFWKNKNAQLQDNEYDTKLRILHGNLSACVYAVESQAERLITAVGVDTLFDFGSIAMLSRETVAIERNKLYDMLDDLINAQTSYNEYLIQNREKLCKRKHYRESTITGYELIKTAYYKYYKI